MSMSDRPGIYTYADEREEEIPANVSPNRKGYPRMEHDDIGETTITLQEFKKAREEK